MGALRCLVAFVSLLQVCLAQGQVPLLASSNVLPFNPSQTTIALEKPYCFYTDTSTITVYLYVVRDGATSTSTLVTNTYTSTNGGLSAPYVAATFPNPKCLSDPNLSQLSDPSAVQSVLDKYVIRVGNDASCFNTNVCNGPLQSGSGYRFMYVFYNSTLQIVYQSLWSSAFTTKNALDFFVFPSKANLYQRRHGKSYSTIDTWPGRRSGGMIVLTSILSVLLFFVLAGLVAAFISNVMNPSSGIESTGHESRTTHSAPHKTDPSEYDTSLEPAERYTTHLQS